MGRKSRREYSIVRSGDVREREIDMGNSCGRSDAFEMLCSAQCHTWRQVETFVPFFFLRVEIGTRENWGRVNIQNST